MSKPIPFVKVSYYSYGADSGGYSCNISCEEAANLAVSDFFDDGLFAIEEHMASSMEIETCHSGANWLVNLGPGREWSVRRFFSEDEIIEILRVARSQIEIGEKELKGLLEGLKSCQESLGEKEDKLKSLTDRDLSYRQFHRLQLSLKSKIWDLKIELKSTKEQMEFVEACYVKNNKKTVRDIEAKVWQQGDALMPWQIKPYRS